MQTKILLGACIVGTEKVKSSFHSRYPMLGQLGNPLLYPPSIHAFLAHLSQQQKPDHERRREESTSSCEDPGQGEEVDERKRTRRESDDDTPTQNKKIKTERDSKTSLAEQRNGTSPSPPPLGTPAAAELIARVPPTTKGTGIVGQPKGSPSLPGQSHPLEAYHFLDAYKSLDLRALEQYRKALEIHSQEAFGGPYFEQGLYLHGSPGSKGHSPEGSVSSSPEAQGSSMPSAPAQTPPPSPLAGENTPKGDYHIDALLKKEPV